MGFFEGKKVKHAYRNLSEYLAALHRSGELKIIDRTVSSCLEISWLTDKESKSPGGGKALFFKNVKDSPFPAVTNIFGSYTRICMALGVHHLDEMAERLNSLIRLSPPKGLREAVSLLPLVLPIARTLPRISRAKIPPCQEVVYTGKDVDITRLPILHHWPGDGGPFITLPLVFTRSLESGKRNMGMYRLQVYDGKTTGMHWHIHKDGSHFFQEYRRAKKRMPVAVAIGSDPATIYAATSPMPRNVDEILLAGFIRKRPVTMTRCVTVDMEVPAEAEFVLEGYVDPEERRLEGPFGDHTGYYSLADEYPVFHVTALTHRKNPVYCTTLVGPPPMEDCYLGKATERIFLPLIKTVLPEIVDYWFPWEGAFHNAVVVSIDKEYPGHAQKLMSGIWGQGQMSFCKAVIVLDRWVDPQNSGQVLEMLMNRLDITTDITMSRGILDVLDHSSPTQNFGNKIGIDLTERMPGEPPRTAREESSVSEGPEERELLSDIQQSLDGVLELTYLAPGTMTESNPRNRILAIKVEKAPGRGGGYFAEGLFGLDILALFNIIILYDPGISLKNRSMLLWKLCNNVDPVRDIHIRYGRMVVDACKKGTSEGHMREWPEDLRFD